MSSERFERTKLSGRDNAQVKAFTINLALRPTLLKTLCCSGF